jgi:hypothetical protein
VSVLPGVGEVRRRSGREQFPRTGCAQFVFDVLLIHTRSPSVLSVTMVPNRVPGARRELLCGSATAMTSVDVGSSRMVYSSSGRFGSVCVVGSLLDPGGPQLGGWFE